MFWCSRPFGSCKLKQILMVMKQNSTVKPNNEKSYAFTTSEVDFSIEWLLSCLNHLSLSPVCKVKVALILKRQELILYLWQVISTLNGFGNCTLVWIPGLNLIMFHRPTLCNLVMNKIDGRPKYWLNLHWEKANK